MQTLKNLCKASILILCTLFIYSCDNETDFSSYQLQTIQWKLSADDTTNTYTIEVPVQVDRNETDTHIDVTFSEEGLVEETSQFYCDDVQLFNSLTSKEEIPVSITTDTKFFFDSNYTEILSDLQAPLSLDKTVLPPMHRSKETTKLPPHCQMTTEYTAQMEEQTATYLATFINDRGETIEISGKWKGTFLRNSEVLTTLTTIKEIK